MGAAPSGSRTRTVTETKTIVTRQGASGGTGQMLMNHQAIPTTMIGKQITVKTGQGGSGGAPGEATTLSIADGITESAAGGRGAEISTTVVEVPGKKPQVNLMDSGISKDELNAVSQLAAKLLEGGAGVGGRAGASGEANPPGQAGKAMYAVFTLRAQNVHTTFE